MSAGLDRIKYAKSQTDIVEIIGRFVKLKRNGANYVGLSPFCEERTPSFVVSPVKNIFKCYSSGKGGDVLDFIMAVRGCVYREALEYLAVEQPAELPTYIPPPPLPISYTPESVMYSTLKGYNNNDFAQWLFKLFGMDAIRALAIYRVGTSKHKFWNKDFPDYISTCNANVFWYCDIENKVRGGKIMGYDAINGKRIKEPFPHLMWAHKKYVNREPLFPDYNLSICLFGEHLLKGNNKPVHIFESEKTAIVASLCYPEWLCLASGSLTNLTYERCKVLEGRTIVLHPDVGAEERWRDKCTQLAELIPGTWYLHTLESDIKGYDFCDWIIDNLI